MKTKFFVLALALMGILVACGEKKKDAADDQKADSVVVALPENLDTANTWVEFRATKQAGQGEHTGKFLLKEGKLEGKDGKITGGKLVFDIASLKITDEQPLPAADEKKLVDHLKSPDFFNLEKHPEATFEITEVKENIAKGNLTVAGKTKEVELNLSSLNLAGAQAKVEGTAKVMREDFGMKFQPKQAVINNEVELKFQLAGK
ncbi:MAG: YceI family protein [Bacteroidetes bacterium]|jgi:polyisoprenoid-binding protein YceI|nr:YceI family protein [Bacteroidota bacterium]